MQCGKRKIMLIKKIKEVLEKKEVPLKEFTEADRDFFATSARKYLNCISMRRYIFLDIEYIFDEVVLVENPIYPHTVSEDELLEICKPINQKYREKYSVSFEEEIQDEVKECLLWLVIDEPREAPFDESVGYGWALAPVCGCGMGDELPIYSTLTMLRDLIVVALLNEAPDTELLRKLVD